jgi:hypothetical protein
MPDGSNTVAGNSRRKRERQRGEAFSRDLDSWDWNTLHIESIVKPAHVPFGAIEIDRENN